MEQQQRQPLDILRKYWGYTAFRECQEEIIDSVLAGKDTLGLLPTGGGKSLTFQVPGLMLEGLSLVITPLISLMKDQVDNLRTRRIKAACIHSGMRLSQVRNAIDSCLYGNCRFLYISPERLASPSFRSTLRLLPVKLIVVDEAHCISQWGYDFRPSYLKIAEVRELFPDIPVLALTATATPDVVDDIMAQLHFREKNVLRRSFARTNLSYIVRNVEDKLHKLDDILSKSRGSAIVYVRSRKKAKLVADTLVQMGYNADFYHAGLANEEKQDKQERWKNGRLRIIVATNAFGMGIDKSDVRVIVHTDIPNSLEEYYQEAGRAGRDGKRAYAVMLVNPRDKSTLKRRISEAFPPIDYIKEVYVRACNFLDIGLGGGFDCQYPFNLDQFCITFHYERRTVHSALRILTQARYIDYIEEAETQARVMIKVEKRALYDIHGITPVTEQVLETLLRNYSGLFADYVFIDEENIAFQNGISTEQVYEALLALTRMHILHYIPRRRTPYIYFPSSRVEPKHLLIPDSVYAEGKDRLMHRIQAIADYAFDASYCRENRMLEYFGEKPAAPCGRCDVCVERKKEKKERLREISEGILYMLSQRPCKTDDFRTTLSFREEEIAEELQFLVDEGLVKFINGYYSR